MLFLLSMSIGAESLDICNIAQHNTDDFQSTICYINQTRTRIFNFPILARQRKDQSFPSPFSSPISIMNAISAKPSSKNKVSFWFTVVIWKSRCVFVVLLLSLPQSVRFCSLALFSRFSEGIENLVLMLPAQGNQVKKSNGTGQMCSKLTTQQKFDGIVLFLYLQLSLFRGLA